MKYYYDLHIHSALSPCGDEDMTPNNIVNMSLLNGLDIIALSDHNTCKNVRAVSEVARRAGILFIPAMELETAEEIHVLCLFPSVDAAELFEREIVSPALPDIANNESIFGRQQILDENDNETGTDGRYLINATSLTIDSVGVLAARYGAAAVPAHIDKRQKACSRCWAWLTGAWVIMSLSCLQTLPDNFSETHFSLKGMGYRYLYNSDAHYLAGIAERGGKIFLNWIARTRAPKMLSDLLKIIIEVRFCADRFCGLSCRRAAVLKATVKTCPTCVFHRI